MAHPTFDDISPDFPPGSEEERDITNACVVVPARASGVVGVTAVGNTKQVDGNDDPDEYLKSYYSSYGVGVAEVTAPGGDFYYGRGTEGQPFGLVLSTWPSTVRLRPQRDRGPAARGRRERVLLPAGHVDGRTARGRRRGADHQPLRRPGQPAERQDATGLGGCQVAADRRPAAVPDDAAARGAPALRERRPYVAITRPDGSPQECQGGEGYNSWYGSGQINALSAVTPVVTAQQLSRARPDGVHPSGWAPSARPVASVSGGGGGERCRRCCG